MGTILEAGVGGGAGDWLGAWGGLGLWRAWGRVVVRVVVHRGDGLVHRGDAGPTYRLEPPQHASQNFACNSLACLSKFEIRSLKFRGLWAAGERGRKGIACEIWGRDQDRAEEAVR